jgi:hypothetical protein
METLVSLVYRSRATRPLDTGDMDALLLDARANNQMVDVTGALLHHGQAFLQYLEGPSHGVAHVFARIQRASQHAGIETLQHGPTPLRHFQRWHMGFARAPDSLLQKLSHEQWTRTVPWLEDEEAASPGLGHLLAFWNQATHTAA